MYLTPDLKVVAQGSTCKKVEVGATSVLDVSDAAGIEVGPAASPNIGIVRVQSAAVSEQVD